MIYDIRYVRVGRVVYNTRSERVRSVVRLSDIEY